jgi:hypothetical protein
LCHPEGAEHPNHPIELFLNMLVTSSYAQVAIYVVGLQDILPVTQELQQFW